jgi:RNase P/RNase MRP subunit p30
MHHRNSGLNHVLCKLARDKNISIGFSFFELFISNKKEIILGRIIQNVRFLKKYRVECFISSFASEPYQMRSKEDFNSFSRFIGIQ